MSHYRDALDEIIKAISRTERLKRLNRASNYVIQLLCLRLLVFALSFVLALCSGCLVMGFYGRKYLIELDKEFVFMR